MNISKLHTIWLVRVNCAAFTLQLTFAQAQLTGQTQTPNAVNEGNAKSLEEQVGAVDEISQAAFDHLEFYLLDYFKPATGRQNSQTTRGRELMDSVACTSCHVADMTINNDRRVADVETIFDPQRGIFNGLFTTVTGSFSEEDDG